MAFAEVSTLPWTAVDPTKYSYDSSEIAAIARRHTSLTSIADPNARAAAIHRDVTRLCEPWLTAYPWALFCHSQLPDSGASPKKASVACEDAVARVVESAGAWRAFLEEIKAVSDDLDFDQRLHRSVECAAARLLPHVVDITDVYDSWHQTLSTALRWCCEAKGVASPVLVEIISDTISGQFTSWEEPGKAEARESFRILADRIAEAEIGAPDGLEEWVVTRTNAFKSFRPRYPKKAARAPAADGHRDYIQDIDVLNASLCERRDRLLEALEACRRDAQAGGALTFGLLSSWQELVLSERGVKFRSGEAFAKDGREKYGFSPRVEARFERCLADAKDTSAHVALRAARAYLDVIFFQPFHDGNARAARMALDFVLAREGWGIEIAGQLFRLARAPTDGKGANEFARQISLVLAPLKKFGGA